MTDSQQLETNIPPVIVERDGRFYVQITTIGGTEVRAPLGDGSWFLAHFLERIVEPALKAAKR